MQNFIMRSLREGKNNLNDCSTYDTMIAGTLKQGGLFMAAGKCRSQAVPIIL